MLEHFGDGTTVICHFAGCDEVLTYDTVTADRFPKSGKEGGRYVRGNLRPACSPCNTKDGQRVKDLPPLVADPNGIQW